MKTQIAVETITQAVTLACKTVSRRNSLPILSNALFQASGDSLAVTTTDLDITSRITLPGVKVFLPGDVTMPASRLLAILKSCHHDVEFDSDEKSNVAIRNGSNFSLAGLPANEFPPMPEMLRPRQASVRTSDLRTALKRVSFAISTDESRYVLNGVLFAFKDDKLTIVATDGRRLALADMLAKLGKKPMSEKQIAALKKSLPIQKAKFEKSNDAWISAKQLVETNDCDQNILARRAAREIRDFQNSTVAKIESLLGCAGNSEFILPAKAVDTLLSSLPKAKKATKKNPFPVENSGEVIIQFGSCNGCFSFNSGVQSVQIYSKFIKGNYPNYRQVIPGEAWEEISFNRVELLDAVKTAEIQTSEKANAIKLEFRKNECVVSSNSPERGDCRISVAINYKGPDFYIGINPRYLREAIAAVDTDEITAEFEKPNSGQVLGPIVLKINEPWISVTMPMRLDGACNVEPASETPVEEQEVSAEIPAESLPETISDETAIAPAKIPTLQEYTLQHLPKGVAFVHPAQCDEFRAAYAKAYPVKDTASEQAIVSDCKPVSNVHSCGEIDIITVPVYKPLIARRNQAKRILESLAVKYADENRPMTDRELSLLDDVLPGYIANLELQILENDKLCARQREIETAKHGEPAIAAPSVAAVAPAPVANVETAKPESQPSAGGTSADDPRQVGFARFQFGFADVGEIFVNNDGLNFRFVGNFNRKKHAFESAAGKPFHHVKGYLNGKLARGWVVYETFMPEPASVGNVAGDEPLKTAVLTLAEKLKANHAKREAQRAAIRSAKLSAVVPVRGELPEPAKPFEISTAQVLEKVNAAFAPDIRVTVAGGIITKFEILTKSAAIFTRGIAIVGTDYDALRAVCEDLTFESIEDDAAPVTIQQQSAPAPKTEPVLIMAIRKDESGQVINGNFREVSGPVVLPPIPPRKGSALANIIEAGERLAALMRGEFVPSFAAADI